MSTTITSITVSGLDCTELNGQERQKLAEQMISDRAAGPVLQTPAGDIDRRDNPTVTIEIEY